MPGVLVDVPTTALALVGPVAPQVVQVTVGQLTPGQSLDVLASAVGQSRTLRSGPVATTQVQIVDVASPINTEISYTVVVDGVSIPVGQITVPYAGDYVLQSPDGRQAFPFAWHGHEDPRDLHMRTATFDVPNRRTPVVRWDVAGGESGVLPMRMTRTASEALRRYLTERGPVLVVRTDGRQLDIPAAQYIAVVRATRSHFGFDGHRLWQLSFEVTDPEPGADLAALATPEDFDEVYALATPEDFDDEWALLTPEDFDATDWTQR